jgi:hypothetical protein
MSELDDLRTDYTFKLNDFGHGLLKIIFFTYHAKVKMIKMISYL